MIRIDLDAAVILGAFQTVFVVRRDDNIVLIMRSFQLTVLTGQFDRTIRIDLGPDRRQGHVAVRGDLIGSLIGSVARLPIQELVAAVGKGVLVQCMGSIAGNGVDLDFLAAAVVRLVGQNHSGFGIVNVAVLILNVRIGAVGAGNGDRVVRLAVVIRIRQVDDDGAIGLEDTAVRQSDLTVRGDDAAASGDLDVAGGVVAGHAVAVSRYIVALGIGVAVAGDGDRAVSVGLVPLRVPGLIHIGRYFDHGVGGLEVAGAVGRSIPTAEGPTGHSEGICRSQGLREGLRVVGTYGVLNLVCLSGAVVRQVDEFCAVLEGSRLGPLSVERYALARDTGDRSSLRISGAVDPVLHGVPAGEGLAAVGEGVGSGVDGRLVILDEVDHIIAGAAVGLVDHGNVVVRRCSGELVAGADLAAVIGQNDGAVRLHDRSFGDLDVFLALIEVIGVLGPVDRAAVAVLHLDAAIRLRGELTAIGGISRSHGDIILRMVGAVIGRAIQNAVLTGELDRAIQVDLCPLCVEDLFICDILHSRFSGIFLATGLSHPVQEDVSCPGKGILDGRNSVAFNDLDQNFIVLAVVDVVSQRKDVCVGDILAILIGDVRLAVRAGNGDGAVALTVLIRIRAVDDDRTVRQKLATVRHTDHGAVRQSHTAALGDLDLTLVVAAGIFSAVAIAGGVGVRIIGITIGTGNGDGTIRVRLEPLCEQSLVDLVLERQDVAGLIERSTAVGGLIPTTKRPAGHLEGAVLQLALQDGVSCVAHELSILLGRAVIGIIDDVGGIPILRIPHCIERDICRNLSILGVGLAVAAAAVIPASEAAVAGIGEQAVADLEHTGLADLLLHFLIAVVGIIGDRNIASGKIVRNLLVGGNLAAARAIRVRCGQDDGAVRLDHRAAGNGDVLAALVRLVGVGGSGDRRGGVIRHLHAAGAIASTRGGLVRVVRGHGHIVLVLRCGNFIILAGEDDRTVRAHIGDGQNRGLFIGRDRDSGGSVGDLGCAALCTAAVLKGIGLGGVAVKVRNLDGIAHADKRLYDFLGAEDRIPINILDGNIALIFRCVCLLEIPDNVLIRSGVADRDLFAEAVRELRSRAAIHASDADQLIAGAIGREEVSRAVLQHLQRAKFRGLCAAKNDLGADGHKVLAVVEADCVGAVAVHIDCLIHLTGIERISAIAQRLRRGDGQLFAACGLGGVGSQCVVVRTAINPANIVHGDRAGGALLVPEVDLQAALFIRNGVGLGQVIVQRPAIEGLSRCHVGLAHTGCLRGHRLNAGDLSCVLLLLRCGGEIALAQLGAVHGDVLHLPHGFLEVDAVLGHGSSIRGCSDHTVAASLKLDVGRSVVGLIGVVIFGQIKNVLTSSIGRTSLSVLDGDQVAGIHIIQIEADVLQRFILKPDRLLRSQRTSHSLGQSIFQRHIGTGRSIHHNAGHAGAITGQFHIGRQLRLAVVLLDDDLRTVLREHIGDLGIHRIRDLIGSSILIVHLIGDLVQGVTGDQALYIALLVLHLSAGTAALGDHLVIGIKLVAQMIHKADAVLDEIGVFHRLIVEGDRRAVGDTGVSDLHELARSVGSARDGVAIQGEAAHDGSLDGDLVPIFQGVLGLIAVGGCHFRIVGVVVQLNSDRLGIIQRVTELHHGVIVSRCDCLISLLAGNGSVTRPVGPAYSSFLTLDGADGIGLKDIAAALEVDRDGHIAVRLVLAIPEHDLLTGTILHEHGGRVAALGGVAGRRSDHILERMGLAHSEVSDHLRPINFLTGVRILLDDGDALRLAGVLISDLDLTDAVVLAAESGGLPIYRNGRLSGSALIVGHIGGGEVSFVDGVALGLGAAVLAEQLDAASLGDEHHIAGILGVLKGLRGRSCGTVRGKGYGLILCRIAGDRRGKHAGFLIQFLLHRVGGAQIIAVTRGLDSHGGLGALVGQCDRNGAALGIIRDGNCKLVANDGTELAFGPNRRIDQRIAGDVLLSVDGVGSASGGSLYGVGEKLTAALYLTGHLNVHHLFRNGYIVDGLFRVGSWRELQRTAVQVTVLTVQRQRIAVDAGSGDADLLTLCYGIGVLEIGGFRGDLRCGVGGIIHQLNRNGPHIGLELEHDNALAVTLVLFWLDGHIGVRAVCHIAIQCGGGGNDLRLTHDGGDLIGEDQGVGCLARIHQLDGDVLLLRRVLLIEEVHDLLGIIVLDKHRLALTQLIVGRVLLHSVACDGRRRDGQRLAGGHVRIGGFVKPQACALEV